MADMIGKNDNIVDIKVAGNNVAGENLGGNNPQIQGGNRGTMIFGPGGSINVGSTKTDGANIHTGKNESGGGNNNTEEKGTILRYNYEGHNIGGKNKGGNNPQIEGGNSGTMIFGPGGDINEGSTKIDGGNIHTGKNESGGGNINTGEKVSCGVGKVKPGTP
ncbi:hypothetical protein CKAN_01292300 [Cinnamomum micranthum f. kanehirae]|uniref:Uncharacterized protein n=1 Tax=Cinnamomum micranthum f. kanehirae TaxID=337451 RepID=A0A3S3MQ63_9MAGN|nr:hypothetical protein CKAN_01292300 [Cinnamomum micranthum f. kanehirae]